jgi:hypothetical protein
MVDTLSVTRMNIEISIRRRLRRKEKNRGMNQFRLKYIYT